MYESIAYSRRSFTGVRDGSPPALLLIYELGRWGCFPCYYSAQSRQKSCIQPLPLWLLRTSSLQLPTPLWYAARLNYLLYLRPVPRSHLDMRLLLCRSERNGSPYVGPASRPVAQSLVSVKWLPTLTEVDTTCMCLAPSSQSCLNADPADYQSPICSANGECDWIGYNEPKSDLGPSTSYELVTSANVPYIIPVVPLLPYVCSRVNAHSRTPSVRAMLPQLLSPSWCP